MSEKKRDLELNIFYLCVHKKLHERVHLSGTITRHNFFRLLGETYHIPKKLRIIVLKEMQECEMIKELKGTLIKVLPIIIDPELNLNKFYENANIF